MKKGLQHLRLGIPPFRSVAAAVLLVLMLIAACSDGGHSYIDEAPEAANLRGQVLDENGTALADVTVTIDELGLGRNTDADGWFRFHGITPGSYVLRLSKNGYEQLSLDVNLNAGNTLVLPESIIKRAEQTEEKTPDPPEEPGSDQEDGGEDNRPGDSADEDNDDEGAEEEPEEPGDAGQQPALVAPVPANLLLSGIKGETLSAAFTIGNAGDAPLVYAISSESPVQLSTDSGDIAPGGHVSVEVTLECTGEEQPSSLLLETNDPEHPEVSIPIRLSCTDEQDLEPTVPGEPGDPQPNPRPRLGSTPATITLSGVTGSTVQAQLTISNTGEARLNWEAATDMELQLTPRSGSTATGRTTTLRLSGTCAGNASGNLIISSNDPERAEAVIAVERTCTEPEPQPDPEPDPDPSGGYSIELEFVGNVPESYRQAVTNAAARWSEIITTGPEPMAIDPACGGHLPSGTRTVQNLLVSVKVEELGTGVLGYGGICGYQRSSGLPPYGYIILNEGLGQDPDDTQILEAAALHEIGHVLGLGTLWDEPWHPSGRHIDYAPSGACDNSAANSFSRKPRYLGAHGLAEYKVTTGQTASQGIPLESELGKGSRCGHWDADALPGELMGAVLYGGQAYLSSVTVASLRDLGYSVDMSKADQNYNPAVLGSASLTGEVFRYDADFVSPGPVFAD